LTTKERKKAMAKTKKQASPVVAVDMDRNMVFTPEQQRSIDKFCDHWKKLGDEARARLEAFQRGENPYAEMESNVGGEADGMAQ